MWTRGVIGALLMAMVAIGRARAGAADPPAVAAAAATRVAQAWLDAMALGEDADGSPVRAIPLDDALALTAAPLYVVAYDADQRVCSAAPASTPAALRKVLRCLRANMSRAGELRAWTPAAEKAIDDGGPLARHLGAMRALASTATLVHLHAGCGLYNDVVLAVTRDRDGALKVAAVFSRNGACEG
jgi:hypothetical protein